MRLMKNLRVIVALGKIAFDSVVLSVKEMGNDVRGWKFENGKTYQYGNVKILCIFHPSPRNVNTGRISKIEFIDLFRKAKEMAE